MEVEKYVKRRSLSTAIISIVVALVVILPAIWASGRLVVEAQALYTQATVMVNSGGVTKLHDWAVNTELGAWINKKMAEHGYKLDEELPKLTLQAAQITSNYVAQNATQAAKNVFGFIIDFGIALLAFFYLLRDGDYYYQGLRDLTPLHEDDKKAIFDTLRTTLSSVMRGLMLTAVLQGVSIGIGHAGLRRAVLAVPGDRVGGRGPDANRRHRARLDSRGDLPGLRGGLVGGNGPAHLVRGRARDHRQFHQAARDEAWHRPADDRAVSRNPRRPRSIRPARIVPRSRDHVGVRGAAARL